MRSVPHCPSAEAIALLDPFERLPLSQVQLVHSAEQARHAAQALQQAQAWGFDTESKPTFHKDQVSDGPHTVQLATPERAWVFQLHDPDCRAVVADLLAWPHAVKAGFGLRDDRARIERKLGVTPNQVLELNTVFRQRGHRREVGLKTAVALLFQRRFLKSKKTATTNWAAPQLSEAQLLYAANDAYGAIRVYHALKLAP
ncbi:3'-5' exonuclease [Macromonas nakdongensis]|uniref:3'-5' exonuclease n=1 Tax=Macromonas nakdongensis TaxID=1843082 RepID=UPI000C339ED0|nr:3'-5' exonuclease [Macromonas nakdongensis]